MGRQRREIPPNLRNQNYHSGRIRDNDKAADYRAGRGRTIGQGLIDLECVRYAHEPRAEHADALGDIE